MREQKAVEHKKLQNYKKIAEKRWSEYQRRFSTPSVGGWFVRYVIGMLTLLIKLATRLGIVPMRTIERISRVE